MRIRSTTLGVAVGFVLTSSVAQATLCTRLPLSDVALNRTDATTAARTKLKQYAVEKLTERGWSGEGAINSKNETVMCTPYFSFGAIKAGFRCLVTATFCVNGQQQALETRVPRVTIKKVPVPRPARRPQATQRAQGSPAGPARQAPLPRKAVTAKPASKTVRPRSKAPAPAKRTVKLRLKGSSYEISGVLKKYNRVSYVIAPPDSENITVPADRFDCVSGDCPKAAN
ncbi:MAG: hypothetical protein ACR2PI_10725 [Hyphomicrobiaceae bacterium]